MHLLIVGSVARLQPSHLCHNTHFIHPTGARSNHSIDACFHTCCLLLHLLLIADSSVSWFTVTAMHACAFTDAHTSSASAQLAAGSSAAAVPYHSTSLKPRQVPAGMKPTDAHLLSCSLLLQLKVVATLPAVLQLLAQATAVSLTLLRLLLQILDLGLQCLHSTAPVDTLPSCLQWTLSSKAVAPASAPSHEHAAPARVIKEQSQCCQQPGAGDCCHMVAASGPYLNLQCLHSARQLDIATTATGSFSLAPIAPGTHI